MTMGGTEPGGSTGGEASETSSASDSGGSAGTTGAVDPDCALCVESAPEGWFGPIARFDDAADATAPPCNEDWPDAGLTYLSGYNDPGPAVCDCACSVSITSLCPITVILDPTSPDCMGLGAMAGFSAEDGCEDLGDLGLADGNSLFFFTQTSGTDVCNDEVTETIPDPAWDQQVFSCRGAELGEECDGEGRQCAGEVPEGFDTELCIFNEGEHDCPAGDYSERSVFYAGVDDSRNCSQCACAQTPSATCSNDYSLHAEADCSGATVGPVIPNFMCMDVTGGAAIQVNFTGDPSCPVSDPPLPTGEITPSGAVTYCCQPA